MSKPEYDPKEHTDVTHVGKKGDWYTVEGVSKATGQRVSVDIPAQTIESLGRKAADALMRRSLYGESLAKRDGRDSRE